MNADLRLGLHVGDCVDVLRTFPEASVDACVCDPPYGLEFMGKEWDSFRLDDPGTERNRGERAGVHGSVGDGDGGKHPARAGHTATAYGGGKRPSTSRCVGCGKRDQRRNPHSCPDGTAWRSEIIDPMAAPPTSLAFMEWCRHWALEVHRVLKPGGHLIAFGGTRTVHRLACAIEDAGFEIRDTIGWLQWSGFPKSLDVSKAIDAAAGAKREVIGLGAARCEHLERGEACGHGGRDERAQSGGTVHVLASAPATPDAARWQGWGTALKPSHEPATLARKPLDGTVAANVLKWGTGALNLDACRYAYGDPAWPGPQDDGGWGNGSRPGGFGNVGAAKGGTEPNGERNPLGRFPANVYACPKASRAEREAGCEGLPARTGAEAVEREEGSDGLKSPRAGAGRTASEVRNVHPTVKALALMRWLVRLVTPPGGMGLDPFLGSGTTACAAILEGFRWIGIEREAEYARIAEARIAWAEREREILTAQGDLFAGVTLPDRWAEGPEQGDLLRRSGTPGDGERG